LAGDVTLYLIANNLYVVTIARGWLDGNAHDRRSEEVLQRDEETRLETANEADSETEGKCIDKIKTCL